MAQITHKGQPVTTSGQLPAPGTSAPDFLLTRRDLSDVRLADFAGKKKILNIVPSLDTGVCAASARRFNQLAADRSDTVILTVSDDLPFAQKRFCEAEGIDRVVTLSEFRNRDFGQAYGVRFTSGPLAGILSRSLVVLDENNRVLWTQQVPDTTQEPDYAGAFAALG